MSDTKEPDKGAPAPADDFKNFKSEIDRKLGNIKNEVTEALKSSNAALTTQLQNMLKPPQKSQPSATKNDDLENLFYKSPVEYAKRIKEETRAEIREEFQRESADMSKRQSTVQKLYKEFPELNDEDSELTKAALTRYSELSKEDQSPAAYRAAVAEAALDLGVKPKSKRPPEDDSYSVGGSGRGRRGADRKSDEVQPATLEAAKLMGLDDKSIERMKKRVSTRKNFGQWE